MRLAGLEVRDFRSIFVDDAGRGLRVELGRGMNTFVGQNNCGKSNVLRALSLALDPNHTFDTEIDVPGPRTFATPIITLRFIADGDRKEEKDLLAAAAAYEDGLGGGGQSFASRGEVALQVAFLPTADGVRRRELLLTVDERTPAGVEDDQRLADALRRLREAVRFVLIRSGETLESILEGNFREILHSVVRDGLQVEFADAEESRNRYIAGLQESLLAPLRDRLAADVGRLFPEISATHLSPHVPTIERTLSSVDVSLDDLVNTPLDHKGTGVRGGVVVAMLSYLALNAQRGMVFAVEEPEAFLHPSAQEDLRDLLEKLAVSPDVTLLATTHSPYIVTTVAEGRIFCLAKDKEGRTRLAESADGNSPHAALVGGLFHEATYERLLKTATELPSGAQAVLVVEGDGDKQSLTLAAALVGRPDLLADIHISPAGGASKTVSTAVIARAATEKPVLVLLDNDEPGQAALKLLCGDVFRFQKGKTAITYREVFPKDQQDFPYEAEDLFDPDLIQGFVNEQGQSVVDGSKKRPDGAFHYDLGATAKGDLEDYFRRAAGPEHIRRWLELIRLVRTRLGLPDLGEVDALLADAAPPPEVKGDAGWVLIVTDALDYARYGDLGALILGVDSQLPEGVTHIGFYSAAAIQPEIAKVVADYQGLLIDTGTEAQLRRTGKAPDERLAEIVQSLLGSDEALAGSTRRVLLLSGPDEPETLRLDNAIRNTKEVNGRRLAWAVAPRAVPYAAIAEGPQTTDELDEAVVGLLKAETERA